MAGALWGPLGPAPSSGRMDLGEQGGEEEEGLESQDLPQVCA